MKIIIPDNENSFYDVLSIFCYFLIIFRQFGNITISNQREIQVITVFL